MQRASQKQKIHSLILQSAWSAWYMKGMLLCLDFGHEVGFLKLPCDGF